MTTAIVPADERAIRAGASLLREGRLVAFPTETVYGIGADAEDPAAVARIFAAKGRPADHPVIVHATAASALSYWAVDVPDSAMRLAQSFWPGPLTLIVPRAPHVADVITAGQPTIGLRVPSHPVARALLSRFVELGGHGVAAPSANRFGHVSPTTARHVEDDLGHAVAMILDGGPCPLGIESTIVAFTSNDPMILRPGAIDAQAIARVLGRAPASPDVGAPRASGTLPSHYATRTLARLVPASTLLAEMGRHAERDERCAVLARGTPRPDGFDGCWIAAPKDAEGYARALYASLRELDAAAPDVILIESPPDEHAWLAVRDRLARATFAREPDEP